MRAAVLHHYVDMRGEHLEGPARCIQVTKQVTNRLRNNLQTGYESCKQVAKTSCKQDDLASVVEKAAFVRWFPTCNGLWVEAYIFGV